MQRHFSFSVADLAVLLAKDGVVLKSDSTTVYRGRIAPSPTGHLHLGHARTFWIAQQRARERGGVLVFRNDDLDRARCKLEFVSAMFEDLCWFGFEWKEGPFHQSERTAQYRAALDALRERGLVYPCTCSRKDIQAAASAPHADDDEMIYPGTCRPGTEIRSQKAEAGDQKFRPPTSGLRFPTSDLRFCWRFRVPDGETISFVDGRLGAQHFVAGKQFGDFVVWRPDDVPAYQLACVVDDAAMRISEVVRGEDLLISTARQLLLYRALELTPPAFLSLRADDG